MGHHTGLSAAGVESAQDLVGDLRICTGLVARADNLLASGLEQLGLGLVDAPGPADAVAG